MASTVRNLLLKSALLTSAGIAALNAGSASAFATCTIGTLSACTGSNGIFSISNVSIAGLANSTITFTQGIGPNGPSLLVEVLPPSATTLLRRTAQLQFDVAVNQISNPGLAITGYNSITPSLPSLSGPPVPQGGIFNLSFNNNLIESGSIYNGAAIAANPNLSNTGPLNDDGQSLPYLLNTVAIAIGYDFNVGGNGNRPNSLSGVFTTDVPLPLPVVGAGFAFGFTRKLRQRAKSAS